MKLFYKDILGFSFIVLIIGIGGLYLIVNEPNIDTIYETFETLDRDEFKKLIYLHSIESAFVIIGMMMLIVCIIAMVMTFSRNPMLTNVKNIKNTTARISEGDFNIRIPEIGNKDEIAELCISINQIAEKLEQLQKKWLKMKK